jgi:molecular chaperone GrpE
VVDERHRDQPRRAGASGSSGQSSLRRPEEQKGPSQSATAHSAEGSPPAGAGDERPDPVAAHEEEQIQKDITDLLSDVERERDEYLELARRTKADFENYRKRVAGEAREAERRGRAALVRELLPVLDNLERALKASDENEGSLYEGVKLVLDELNGVLRRSGVESYEPAGEPFDPEWHEAMMTRPASGEDAGKVLEVLEKGYRQDGQVLRPARVVVGETNG